MEHNTAAVCATWWWTGKNGYAGNHICKDGSPGGYGVYEVDGKSIKWYYKSIGSPQNYQFRSYDLNKVHITAAEFAPNSTDEALAEYAGVYASPNMNNEVLINVWGYDPEWTVEVKEGSTSLPVKRVSALDPLAYYFVRSQTAECRCCSYQLIRHKHYISYVQSNGIRPFLHT